MERLNGLMARSSSNVSSTSNGTVYQHAVSYHQMTMQIGKPTVTPKLTVLKSKKCKSGNNSSSRMEKECDRLAHGCNMLAYLDEDVVLSPGSSTEVDNLWAQASWCTAIHLPAGVCEALANSQVLGREAITSCQSQRATKVAHQMVLVIHTNQSCQRTTQVAHQVVLVIHINQSSN